LIDEMGRREPAYIFELCAIKRAWTGFFDRLTLDASPTEAITRPGIAGGAVVP
jgi:hypothetical protein